MRGEKITSDGPRQKQNEMEKQKEENKEAREKKNRWKEEELMIKKCDCAQATSLLCSIKQTVKYTVFNQDWSLAS